MKINEEKETMELSGNVQKLMNEGMTELEALRFMNDAARQAAGLNPTESTIPTNVDSEFITPPHLALANDAPVGSFGFQLLDETCAHPVAPQYVGTIHGVKIYLGERKSKIFPVNDQEGIERPYIIIKADCGLRELFEDICYVRGCYDLDRELSGYKPIFWGTPGTWQDTSRFLIELSK
jgi:hypothetical protein